MAEKLTAAEQKRLYELVANPPLGSKVEAAKNYGVGLTLTLRSLTLTPTERSQEMESALLLMEEMQRAALRIDR
ncbi:MAG TPA: hypothetical protein VFK06_05335 [Candidatus Angelobacter sp.]|nr:hypothetical protein [Candidatus Angelobacter sp.]